MTTLHLRTDSPVGILRLTTDGEHLTGVYFSEHRHAPPDLGEEVDADAAPPVLREAVRQLREYFAGTRTDFDLPLSAVGTDFQQRVWSALAPGRWQRWRRCTRGCSARLGLCGASSRAGRGGL